MDTLYYKLNDATMFADVNEGTAIVIDSTTGIYYGMNGFGTCIYENLQAGAAVQDILSIAKVTPGVPEDLDIAVGRFIQSLVDFGIIIPREDCPATIPSIDLEIAKADGFIPACTEYQDVQELLFADPIHEVDIEEGWQPE